MKDGEALKWKNWGIWSLTQKIDSLQNKPPIQSLNYYFISKNPKTLPTPVLLIIINLNLIIAQHSQDNKKNKANHHADVTNKSPWLYQLRPVKF